MSVLLRSLAGLIVWAIAFSAIYALHGVGCTRGWATGGDPWLSPQRLVLLGAWIVSVAIGLVLVVGASRRSAGFERQLGLPLAWTGVGATIVGGLPILLLPDCL